ncbi:hypothetical protein PN36_19440 [Candidatus Thiomargarita nelsonii]|uniref:Uncharacterized protein n=1 Tax=Candidatus Thiomargarita nelsonii TaxID=1003181 RepID=A0A4E0R0Q5_9GAMM|nr:hypothetical protein PN36_19440 [Candidatus Thiomargarita nelsonii]
MQNQLFVENEKLTKEYQRYFNEPATIGYYGTQSELSPKEKWYYLVLEKTGKKILLGATAASISIRIEDMYFVQSWDFLKPYASLAKLEREVNRSQKRLDLIKQISMIKTWGRGVIAKIATNLGRKIGAIRSMLSVLTKEGLLVRIQRGQYAVAS